MDISVKIENAKVIGDMVEGDVAVTVAGATLMPKPHFKTNKNVEKEIPLSGGFTLVGVVTVELPNNVCITGKIKQGFLSFDFPKQCFPAAINS